MIEKFFLSDKPAYKWSRHLVFWIIIYIASILIYGTLRISNDHLTQWGLFYMYKSTLVESLMFMSPHIFLTYAVIYFLFPKYLYTGKYGKLIIGGMIVIALTTLVSLLITRYPVIWYKNYMGIYTQDMQSILRIGILGPLRGSFTFGGFAISVKLIKNWYLKKQELQALAHEKVKVELQVLKNQLHPHFLFNTLNNLYGMTINTSPKVSKTILGLSDLLHYMLHDCKADKVPLQQELEFCNNYVSLEKIRTGNKLDLRFDVKGNIDDYQIAPLLLLPLLENAFKHGISESIDQAWLTVDIQVKNGYLHCKMVNGMHDLKEKDKNLPSGIGLENLRKRLELLYPGQYQLECLGDGEVFIGKLVVKLEAIDERVKQRGIQKIQSIPV